VTDLLPSHRNPAVEQVLKALKGARRVVLTTHMNADGDGIGSQVALAEWLRAKGVKVSIVNPTPFPQAFTFLLEDSELVVDAASTRGKEVCRAADLLVVLDTGEVPRLGRVKPMVDHLPAVVVDHHPTGDAPIPGISLRDPDAAATGELVFHLLEAAGGPWTPHAASACYVAILTDTGGFRFSNTTPRAFRVAAELVERGAAPEPLYQQVYGRSSLRRLRLLQAALAELSVEGRMAWMTVPSGVFQGLGAHTEDLEGFVDYPRSLEGVEVALLFRTLVEGGTKVSFRSSGRADVNAIARRFGGGGHTKASGALIPGDPDEVREAVLQAVREALEGEPAGTVGSGAR